MHYLIPDFRLQSVGTISNAFISREIYSFKDALQFVKQLPYKRNENKKDNQVVLKDLCGTCSTKHALIKRLADEQGLEKTELMLGIFMLNKQASNKVANVLNKYQIEAIPEAHNYLKINGLTIDLTIAGESCNNILGEPLEEITISPEQVSEFKSAYHKKYIENWLVSNRKIQYNLNEMMEIREKCIEALSA